MGCEVKARDYEDHQTTQGLVIAMRTMNIGLRPSKVSRVPLRLEGLSDDLKFTNNRRSQLLDIRRLKERYEQATAAVDFSSLIFSTATDGNSSRVASVPPLRQDAKPNQCLFKLVHVIQHLLKKAREFDVAKMGELVPIKGEIIDGLQHFPDLLSARLAAEWSRRCFQGQHRDVIHGAKRELLIDCCELT